MTVAPVSGGWKGGGIVYFQIPQPRGRNLPRPRRGGCGQVVCEWLVFRRSRYGESQIDYEMKVNFLTPDPRPPYLRILQTVSAILSFVKLMALHPGVQLRAQAEIDEKVGTSSLPSLKQLDDLHYLNAIMKEVLRFAPVGPLGECSA